MDGGQEKAPARVQAQPGPDNRYASAAGNSNVAGRRIKRHRGAASYSVQNGGEPPFNIILKGRVRWALDRLRTAGVAGCTPITEPALRWSAYVFDLRALGVDIQTVHEKHGGDYPGHHARYVLRSIVRKGGTA